MTGVVCCISGGGADQGGSDVVSIKHCILRYGEAIAELSHIVVLLTECLANDLPHWETYHALMVRHLIGMDKQTGFRPVHIGDMWMRFF